MITEKFTNAELADLRDQLQQTVPDPLQIAEILQCFLMSRGYGVSSNMALDAASKMGAAGCSMAAVQKELETVALVM